VWSNGAVIAAAVALGFLGCRMALGSRLLAECVDQPEPSRYSAADAAMITRRANFRSPLYFSSSSFCSCSRSPINRAIRSLVKGSLASLISGAIVPSAVQPVLDARSPFFVVHFIVAGEPDDPADCSKL
jgi:hypothetical protein